MYRRRAVRAALMIGTVLVVSSIIAPAALAKDAFVWGRTFPNKSLLWSADHSGEGAASSIYSRNGLYRFSLRDDGDLVASQRRVGCTQNAEQCWSRYWASHSTASYFLAFQDDGNLVARGADHSTVVWANNVTHKPGKYNYSLTVQNDGNVVEYASLHDPRSSDRRAVWSTKTFPPRDA